MSDRTIFAAALGVLCLATAPVVGAQERLPEAMAGRWSFTTSSAMPLGDAFSVRIDAQEPDGTVRGRLTWAGIQCGTRDEPFEGRFDGKELTFSAQTRARVNTQRVDGVDCPTLSYRFVRGAGSHFLDGQAASSNAARPAVAYLDPR